MATNQNNKPNQQTDIKSQQAQNQMGKKETKINIPTAGLKGKTDSHDGVKKNQDTKDSKGKTDMDGQNTDKTSKDSMKKTRK
jgi:hypothetical protein